MGGWICSSETVLGSSGALPSSVSYNSEGYRLGGWVTEQRSNKETMNSDRRQRLEALPGWVWKVER
jgi:hypothetical protein